MEKTIRRILLIVMVIVLVYLGATGKFSTITDIYISYTDKFEYTDEYRINELQYTSENFYFNTLNENQKKIYSAVSKASTDLLNEVIVSKYELKSIDEASQDAKIAINAFLCDHPEVFYLNSQYVVSITESFLGKILKLQLNYSVSSKTEMQTQINKIDSIVNEIKNSVNGMDTYNQELYVHDYLAKNVRYYGEYEEENLDKYHSAYTALVEKDAVCDGISKAFQIVLNKLGIENYLVTGYINETPHAWNMVKIEGEWVYVDITSDKFVKDENGNTIEAVHTYFNVNKEFISKNHTIDDEDIFPSSTSTDKTYFVKNNCYIAISQDFNSRVEKIFEKQSDRKIVEFSTDLQLNVPEKLVKKLQEMKFNKLKTDGNRVTMTYYNEQNVYIIPKV